MQVNIDMFNVYRGRIDSLYPEGSITSPLKGVTEITFESNTADKDEFRCSVERSVTDDGPVDTIYIVPRSKPGIVVGYIELHYRLNHFESFVTPQYRSISPSITFTLEEENGVGNTPES